MKYIHVYLFFFFLVKLKENGPFRRSYSTGHLECLTEEPDGILKCAKECIRGGKKTLESGRRRQKKRKKKTIMQLLARSELVDSLAEKQKSLNKYQ